MTSITICIMDGTEKINSVQQKLSWKIHFASKSDTQNLIKIHQKPIILIDRIDFGRKAVERGC